MTFKQKIGAGLATATMVGTLLAPATFAATTVRIVGNGNNSTNKAKVKNKKSNVVVQSNKSFIFNGVLSVANSGGNKANNNTGAGGGTVNAGPATSTVSITVGGSSNDADVDSCGCPDGDTTLVIRENGNNSDNRIRVRNSDETVVVQSNKSAIVNVVGSVANSGGNTANSNTGSGGGSVDTDTASSSVTIGVTGSSNTVNSTP